MVRLGQLFLWVLTVVGGKYTNPSTCKRVRLSVYIDK